jgi:hypothetical protein
MKLLAATTNIGDMYVQEQEMYKQEAERNIKHVVPSFTCKVCRYVFVCIIHSGFSLTHGIVIERETGKGGPLVLVCTA